MENVMIYRVMFWPGFIRYPTNEILGLDITTVRQITSSKPHAEGQ